MRALKLILLSPVLCSHTFLWMSTSSLLTGLVQMEPESWGMVKNLSFFSSTVAFRDNLRRGKKSTSLSHSFQLVSLAALEIKA